MEQDNLTVGAVKFFFVEGAQESAEFGRDDRAFIFERKENERRKRLRKRGSGREGNFHRGGIIAGAGWASTTAGMATFVLKQKVSF